MQNKRLENSVRNLINLYIVTIGIALTLAVTILVDPKQGLASVTLVSGLLFIAFVSTLVPFFHGALRHLDDVYIENAGSTPKKGALIIDFLLLLLHALAFLVLAQLVTKPGDFAWFLVVVLTIDVVWGLFAAFASSSSPTGPSAEGRWAIINAVFVLVVAAYLMHADIPFSGYAGEQGKLAVLVALACVLRSMFDYVLCRAFYFPDP